MSRVQESMTWDAFARELIDALQNLAVGELIRLDVWTTAGGGERELLIHAYAIRHARHRARVAVAAGRCRRLTSRQKARLAATGWHHPSGWAGPDHYLDGDFAQVEELGARFVQALRQVWDVSDPSGVEWSSRGMSEPRVSVVTRVRRVT